MVVVGALELMDPINCLPVAASPPSMVRLRPGGKRTNPCPGDVIGTFTCYFVSCHSTLDRRSLLGQLFTYGEIHFEKLSNGVKVTYLLRDLDPGLSDPMLFSRQLPDLSEGADTVPFRRLASCRAPAAGLVCTWVFSRFTLLLPLDPQEVH